MITRAHRISAVWLLPLIKGRATTSGTTMMLSKYSFCSGRAAQAAPVKHLSLDLMSKQKNRAIFKVTRRRRRRIRASERKSKRANSLSEPRCSQQKLLFGERETHRGSHAALLTFPGRLFLFLQFRRPDRKNENKTTHTHRPGEGENERGACCLPGLPLKLQTIRERRNKKE